MDKSILLADESFKTRAAIGKLLTESGYEVIDVENGQEALEILNINKVPKMIIISANLREFDALHVCKEIRKEIRTKTTPILIIREEAVDEVPFRERNVTEFCSKTLERNAMLEKVNLIVEHGSSEFVPDDGKKQKMQTIILSSIGIICFLFVLLAVIVPMFQTSKKDLNKASKTSIYKSTKN